MKSVFDTGSPTVLKDHALLQPITKPIFMIEKCVRGGNGGPRVRLPLRGSRGVDD